MIEETDNLEKIDTNDGLNEISDLKNESIDRKPLEKSRVHGDGLLRTDIVRVHGVNL